MIRFLVLFVCIILINTAVFGFDLGFRYNAKTGDTKLDATLGELNTEVKGDRETFISQMSLSYGVPKIKLEDLIFKVKMTPADVYMTLEIGDLINRPIDIVVNEYKINKGKGWGVIAKNLGIKPGSSAFHALKNGATLSLENTKKAKNSKGKAKGKNK